YGGGTPIELPPSAPVTRANRKRAGNAFGDEVLQQAQEERQIRLSYAFLVERQNVRAPLGLEKEIRILNALSDPFERQHLPKLERAQKLRELRIADLGVNGHEGGFTEQNKCCHPGSWASPNAKLWACELTIRDPGDQG